MLTVEEIEAIRRAHFCDQHSIRAIARDQRHHRRTVREALAGTRPPPRPYRRSHPRPRPVVGAVSGLIDAWLEADRAVPPKQRHTAKRIFDRLVREHGYGGKERAVREYVHLWKQEHHGAVIGFVPLAYAPGAEAQCDWGEAVVRIAGVEQTAHLFCLRLCYSLKCFVCAFPAPRQECFFAGHVAAFTALGGVPGRITYDNLSSAVRRVLEGHTRQEQEAFVAVRGHYLFGSHFCTPGKEGAHEKPLVESLVGYARRNFLVPIPDQPSWEALNVHLAACCAAEDPRPASGRAGTIGALWQEEQAHLRPLPAQPYPCCRTVVVHASRQGLVRFECNGYSVPPRHWGQILLLRAFPWAVEIGEGRMPGTTHERLYGRGDEQLDPLHYLPLLERKPGAFALARPIQRWAAQWPPIYHTYRAALHSARPEGATREFVRILQLHARYPTAVLAAALERALALGCFAADGVEQLARQATAPPLPPPQDAGPPPAVAGLPEVTIPLPDLQCFAALLPEVAS